MVEAIAEHKLAWHVHNRSSFKIYEKREKKELNVTNIDKMRKLKKNYWENGRFSIHRIR